MFVDCPTCQARVEWIGENRYRPFCSERCKKIDLGDWAAERFRVPEKIDEPDSEAPPPILQ